MNPDNRNLPPTGMPQPSSTPYAPFAAPNQAPAPQLGQPIAAPVPTAAPVLAAPSALPRLDPAQEAYVKHTVAQAEEIVKRTSQDPFRQVQELERLKATYINSRFGKNIKISDS